MQHILPRLTKSLAKKESSSRDCASHPGVRQPRNCQTRLMIYSGHDGVERTWTWTLLPSNFVYIQQQEIETRSESSLSSHYTLLNWFVNPRLCSAPFIQSDIKDAWDERAPHLARLTCKLAAAFRGMSASSPSFVGEHLVKGSGGGSWHLHECLGRLTWWGEIYKKK